MRRAMRDTPGKAAAIIAANAKILKSIDISTSLCYNKYESISLSLGGRCNALGGLFLFGELAHTALYQS